MSEGFILANCVVCSSDVRDDARFCPSCGAEQPKNETEASDDPFIGQMVASNFRIEKLLGVGGMGKVYKARQLSLDKAVVIKILHDHFRDDPQLVQRFQREARAASRLNHPNSIQVIDFGQDPSGVLYMAIEYLDGKDLFAVLRESGPMPEQRIGRIMSQVCSALAEAHDQHVIHRDLKPENIMLEDRLGQTDYVKVLDFGIAKIQDPDDTSQALTQAGMVCGTPEYMSPEQARGGELDARSDIYALGVLTYQLATGELPFHADSPIGIVTKHILEQPIPPRERKPELNIPERLEKIILTAMSKDAGERFQSTIDMGKAFEALLREPTGAVAVAPAAPVAPAVVTPPAPVTPAPAPATPAPVPPTAEQKTTGPLVAPNTNDPTIAASSSGGMMKWVALAGLLVVLGIGGAFAMKTLMKTNDPIASEGEGEVEPKGEVKPKGEGEGEAVAGRQESAEVIQVRMDAKGAYKLGNLENAVNLQTKLTHIAPDDLQAKQTLLEWTKELDKKKAETPTKKDPLVKKTPSKEERINALRKRVDLYRKKGDYKNALIAAKKLKKEVPDQPVVDKMIASFETELAKKSNPGTKTSAKSRRDKAKALVSQQAAVANAQDRIPGLEKARRIDPGYWKTHMMLMFAYKSTGQSTKACAAAEKYIKLATHIDMKRRLVARKTHCPK